MQNTGGGGLERERLALKVQTHVAVILNDGSGGAWQFGHLIVDRVHVLVVVTRMQLLKLLVIGLESFGQRVGTRVKIGLQCLHLTTQNVLERLHFGQFLFEAEAALVGAGGRDRHTRH